MIHIRNYFLLGFVFLLVYACMLPSSVNMPSRQQTHQESPSERTTEPKWKKVSVSLQGQLMSEIDESSVRHIDSGVVEFREKRTILDASRTSLNYLPPHKYSINIWWIDCTNKTYRLLSMRLYDETNQLISHSIYRKEDVQPMAVVPKSMSAQHLSYVCS